MVHGHQGDLFSDILINLSQFIVRYFWRNMQLLGVNDMTSPAKNFKKRKNLEAEYIRWITKNDQPMICGHTHRPTIPSSNEPRYFNTGSCVHPRYITGIEIENNKISLIKWSVEPRENGILHVVRGTIAKSIQIDKL